MVEMANLDQIKVLPNWSKGVRAGSTADEIGQKCFQDADSNKDGKISEKEALIARGPCMTFGETSYHPELKLDELKKAGVDTGFFKEIDTNKDGVLSVREMALKGREIQTMKNVDEANTKIEAYHAKLNTQQRDLQLDKGDRKVGLIVTGVVSVIAAACGAILFANPIAGAIAVGSGYALIFGGVTYGIHEQIKTQEKDIEKTKKEVEKIKEEYNDNEQKNRTWFGNHLRDPLYY